MYSVLKFGGASIKDLESIKNVGNILSKYVSKNIVIVFSAMGKVTNMLENVVECYFQKSNDPFKELDKVKEFHNNILNNLFHQNHTVFNSVNNLFVEIEWVLEEEPHQNYSYNYDQIVSIGEFLSTQIMSAYLHKIGFMNTLIDVRDLIKTDNVYRNAKIDWTETSLAIRSRIKDKTFITQGFIGCTSENFTTTLGREGSDFTASIIASSLDAEEAIIWKDVPGMMNADPKHFKNTKLLKQISYDEAIELAYYGAKVIHPKTIQPLKHKLIPLTIKSFLTPELAGSQIGSFKSENQDSCSYIVKENQILISISDLDLSFIVEKHISKIFDLLARYSVRLNMMQNSAISLSICVDNDRYKVPSLIEALQEDFQVYFNEKLILYTIRHYNNDYNDEFLNNKEIILEQRSRNTLQLVVKC
jgi:aspartate kinase